MLSSVRSQLGRPIVPNAQWFPHLGQEIFSFGFGPQSAMSLPVVGSDAAARFQFIVRSSCSIELTLVGRLLPFIVPASPLVAPPICFHWACSQGESIQTRRLACPLVDPTGFHPSPAEWHGPFGLLAVFPRWGMFRHLVVPASQPRPPAWLLLFLFFSLFLGPGALLPPGVLMPCRSLLTRWWLVTLSPTVYSVSGVFRPGLPSLTDHLCGHRPVSRSRHDSILMGDCLSRLCSPYSRGSIGVPAVLHVARVLPERNYPCLLCRSADLLFLSFLGHGTARPGPGTRSTPSS